MPFLNAKRIQDYPRLMLFSTWFISGINLLFHQGWIGAFGQVIGGDFIMFYSTGLIYRSTPSLIFDYDTQIATQQSLVKPSALPGYNPFMNPPYVAPLYSLLTFISLHWAILLWTFLAILSVFVSAYYLLKLIPNKQYKSSISYTQLTIIILSFFPFLEGLLSGQNHWLTLLLVSGIIFSMYRERWYFAGFFSGLLIYKPQFILGFVIIWLVWKNFKSLLSFGAVAISWVGLFTLANGYGLFHTYIQQSQIFMELPYIPGFPNYLLVTLYGLLSSFFPQSTQPIITIITYSFFLICVIGVAWLAFRLRRYGMINRTPAIVATLILPLLATPYALLHDMVILIPAFVLWSLYNKSQNFIRVSFGTYLGAFFLTFLGALTKISWVSMLTIGLSTVMISWVISNRDILLRTNLLNE